MKNREVTAFDIDILTEIGNIGAGNAATALSTILNQSINIEISMAKFCDLNEIPTVLGGAEAIRTIVFTRIFNSLNGSIFFILSDEDAEAICNIATGGCEIECSSVLGEITNIITGAYIGAIASMLDGVIEQDPPQIGHDMIKALIDSVIAILSSTADKTMIIGTTLKIQDRAISGFYVMLLEQDSLEKLLDKFNSYRN